MKTTSSPESYRYCAFLTSVWTRGNFSPARKVRSTTAPEPSALSFVRTNAPPLPGFTCWNSTMRQTSRSSSMCIPFLNWFVETVSATAAECSPRLGAAGGNGRRGDPLGAGLVRRGRAEPDLLRHDHVAVGGEPDHLVRPHAGVERLGSLDIGVDALRVDGQIPNRAIREDELDVCDRLRGQPPHPRVVPLGDVVTSLTRAKVRQERRLSEQRSRRVARPAFSPAGQHLDRARLTGPVLV